MIPRTKASIKDTFIASAFIVMGLLLPGSLLNSGFEAHMGGVAMGVGIGWLVRSYVFHTKAQKQSGREE